MTEGRKRSLRIAAFVLFLGALFAAIFFSFQSNPEEHQRQGKRAETESPRPSLPRESVVLPTDFKWEQQENDWFEEVLTQVQTSDDNQSRWDYEFDETLRPGESLITDGWEVSDGVFQFTVLTASEVVSDGETLYQVAAEISEIDLSGGTEMLSMPQVLVRNGMEATVQIVFDEPAVYTGDTVGAPEKSYHLNVTPKGVPDGIQLTGSASASAKNP